MKPGGVFSSLLLLVALTPGCGDSGTGSSPIDPGGPLLDRPSGGKYDCSVSRPMARLGMPWGDFSLLPGTAGSVAVAVAEHNNPDPNPGNSITWSTLGLDGALGSPSVVRSATNRTLVNVSAASAGEKSTIVWSESSENGTSYSLNSVQVDAAGAVVTPASVLATLTQPAGAKIARAGSGYALVWVDSNPSSVGRLNFGLLDESGKLASTPLSLAQSLSIGSIASLGDHFVVSYADYHSDSGLVNRLVFLDSNGSVLGQPIAFEASEPGLFSQTIPSLLVRGDEVLAAWSVSSGDRSYEKQDAATTVRIARFDAQGTLQGSMYDLQAPVKDREAVQPVLIDMDDDVGLLWSDGSILYVCAGCVPNHSQKFVVLDGQSFIPQSNVVELLNTFPSGGLLSSEAARTDDDLLVVSTLTYHTWGEGVSGSIRCTK